MQLIKLFVIIIDLLISLRLETILKYHINANYKIKIYSLIAVQRFP